MNALVHEQPRRQLFGLQIDAMTASQVVDLVQSSVRSRDRLLLGVVGAAKVINARSDELLRDALLECDVLLADGQSVVWASQLLGQPLPERVAGIDLFEMMLELAHQDGRSVYLLGAAADVLAEMEARIQVRWPGLRIAGSRDGYFEESEAAEVAAAIARSNADLLFLGMTSPKKEIFLKTYGTSLGVPVLHGVGGSFDVLAGRVKRAPQSWQRCGMEWAYRVRQEPRRLWKRYLKANTAFLMLLVHERFRRLPLYTRATPPDGERHG